MDTGVVTACRLDVLKCLRNQGQLESILTSWSLRPGLDTVDLEV